jgi:hypothetical protein
MLKMQKINVYTNTYMIIHTHTYIHTYIERDRDIDKGRTVWGRRQEERKRE